MIKVVIFDLDDTLIPESSFVFSAFKELSLKLQERLNDSSARIFNKLKKLYLVNKKEVFDRLFSSYNITLSKNELNVLIDIYRNHIPNITLNKDVLLLFQAIRKMNFKIGIITDGYKVSQRNKIKVLQLDLLVDYFIITDELGREFWKPHPISYQMMKDYFNVQFNEIVYVGDNPNKDFLAPNQLGAKTVMIKSNSGVYGNIDLRNIDREKQPHVIIESLDNLVEVLKLW